MIQRPSCDFVSFVVKKPLHRRFIDFVQSSFVLLTANDERPFFYATKITWNRSRISLPARCSAEPGSIAKQRSRPPP